MANLWTGTITSNDYVSLSEESDITFSSGTNYTIQVLNSCFVREGDTGEGFFISQAEPFVFQAKGDELYIKPFSQICTVNIAD